jgi:serine/threonine-protein kinase
MGQEGAEKASWAFGPGETLAGKYRIERELGTGGMGRVVAAKHLVLDQMVALKFIRTGVLEGSEAVRRFLREARAAARLKSEHIARVLDVATLDTGEPYMVMEYLEGVDLHTVLKQRGALTVEEASEYVIQACVALAEAHAAGIVHRDIKPANLFLTRGPAGVPCLKVLDFGVSKPGHLDSVDVEVTTATSMLGSPRFMSPEQMMCSRDVDRRADIWSLGVLLYVLASGKLPFDADTLGGLFNKVMHEPLRPISQVRVGLPPVFQAVVARCLEKEPARRFQDVRELAHALAPFGPPRARALLERIALYVQAPERAELAAVYSDPALAPRAAERPSAAPSGTAAPWATSSRTAKRTASSRLVAGVWLTALAILLLAVTVLVTRANRVRTLASDAKPTPSATPIPSAAPPPTATPTPSPVASQEIPTIAVTDAPVAPAPKKPGKPALTTKPSKPTPPPDPPAAVPPPPPKPSLPDTRD